MLKTILYWTMHFLIYTLLIIAGGAILGFAITFLLGLFSQLGENGPSLWLHGASIGARYAGVWAGGIAIVLCFIKGYRLRSNNSTSNPD